MTSVAPGSGDAKRDTDGRIVTFYSYKGGTGRSMALANVAWILASAGKRVLTIDWDLEAPGLHRYFHPFLDDPELKSTDGLIDLVLRYAAAATRPSSGSIDAEWYRAYSDVLPYVVSLKWSFTGRGTIDLLCAGRQDQDYPVKVNTFDWQRFYDLRGGDAFFETLKEQARAVYDYVLVDSRTGVSDTSGICTVQMPDVLVTCFTLNYQSIDGIAGVIESVRRARGERPPTIIPIPTRVDPFEKERLDARRLYYRRRLRPSDAVVQHMESDEYWRLAEVPYVPYYAYEELLSTFGDLPGSAQSILGAAEALAGFVSDGAVTRMAAMAEVDRQRILTAYQRRSLDDTPEQLARAAEALYGKLTVDEQAEARRLFSRLVRVTRADEAEVDTLARLAISNTGRDSATVAMAQRFAAIGVLVIDGDVAAGTAVVRIANDALLERWPRLADWLTTDRDFLVWRQQVLGGALTAYELGGRDAGALLSGAPLTLAAEWRERRGADLSEGERQFVQASLDAHQQARQAEAAALLRSQQQEEEIERFKSLGTTTAPHAVAPGAKVGRSRGVLFAAMLVVAGGLGYVGWFATRAPAVAPADRAAPYLAIATAQLTANEFAAARANADSALAVDSTLAPARLTAVRASIALGDTTAALSALATVEGDAATKSLLLQQRAAIRLARDDTAAALADLTRAIDSDSTNPQARYQRGELYRSKNEPQLALREFASAIALRPRYAQAFYARGLVHEGLGTLDSAIADYSNVLLTRDSLTPEAIISAAIVRRSRIGGGSSGDSRNPVRPTQVRTVVAVQYSDSADQAIVRSLELAFKKGGFGTRSSEWRPERVRGDVRYFRGSDADRAAAVREVAIRVLANDGIVLPLPVVLAKGSASPGWIEVWVPALGRGYAPAKR